MEDVVEELAMQGETEEVWYIKNFGDPFVVCFCKWLLGNKIWIKRRTVAIRDLLQVVFRLNSIVCVNMSVSSTDYLPVVDLDSF